MSVGEMTRSCVEAFAACRHAHAETLAKGERSLWCSRCGSLSDDGGATWEVPAIVRDLVLVHGNEAARAFRSAADKAKGEKP